MQSIFYRRIRKENRITVPQEVIDLLNLEENEMVEVTITKLEVKK